MTKDESLHERFGVTSEQLDAWASEYESDDWSHMEFGEITQGRPKLCDEPLDTIVVKVPRSRVAAMKVVTSRRHETRSDFVRRAIENELMEEAV